MMPDRHTLGKIGEKVAAAHVRRLGWKILAQNWRCPYGEIDLIAHDGEEVVVIEVRTRRGTCEMALESVDRRKQKRLLELATWYQEAELSTDTPIRIDVIGVGLRSDGLMDVEMLHDAISW